MYLGRYQVHTCTDVGEAARVLVCLPSTGTPLLWRVLLMLVLIGDLSFAQMILDPTEGLSFRGPLVSFKTATNLRADVGRGPWAVACEKPRLDDRAVLTPHDACGQSFLFAYTNKQSAQQHPRTLRRRPGHLMRM